jgi:hypothetical protein
MQPSKRPPPITYIGLVIAVSIDKERREHTVTRDDESPTPSLLWLRYEIYVVLPPSTLKKSQFLVVQASVNSTARALSISWVMMTRNSAFGMKNI